ncbi:MAG: glycerophosphodiester phosphodiesterase family protein [Aeromicrobium sp.]
MHPLPRQLLRIAFALAVLVVPAAAVAAPPSTPGPDDLIVEAHRGGPALGAPENSVALFEKAVREPVVDRIESDVRWTKDRVPVLVHDATLPSTCTRSGRRVREMTWAELSLVRCSGEPVPRLVDLLDVVRGTDVDLNIELKRDSGQTSSELKAFAKAVTTTVNTANLPRDQVGYSTFYWRDYATTIRQYSPGRALVAFETSTSSKPTTAYVYTAVRLAKDVGATSFTINASDTNEQLSQFIADHGRMTAGLIYLQGDKQVRYALAHRSWAFGADDPVARRRHLDRLLADLEEAPLTRTHTTTSTSPKTVLAKRSLKKDTKTFIRVAGGTGLLTDRAMTLLDGARFSVTVTGKGSGEFELAPAGSRSGIDGVRTKIPNGTKTYTVYASPGDGGRLRIRMTSTATVTVKMTGYRTISY